MPVVAPAIAELGALVLLLVALGILLLAHALVSALFGVTKTVVERAVGWVPWLGKKAVGGVLAVEKRLNNYLTEAVTGVESGIAQTWHVLAATVAWLGTTIANTAAALWRVWWYVKVKYPLDVLWWGVRKLAKAAPVVWKRLDHVLSKTTYVTKIITKAGSPPLRAAVRSATGTLRADVARLNRWAHARVAALEAAVAVELPNALERLGGDVWNLRRSLSRLWKWTRRHERALGAGAMTAAVAFALRRLGATWIRCSNWRKVGRRVCGMDGSALDDLLAGTLAIVGTISLVAFAKEMQDVVAAEANAMRALIRETKG